MAKPSPLHDSHNFKPPVHETQRFHTREKKQQRRPTISILNTAGLSRTYELTTSGCTHMAEIEFYTK